MSELLEVKLSLYVAGVGGEPEPWVCSVHRYKLEGTCASGRAVFCASLVPVDVPVILCVGCALNCDAECVLAVSDLLGVELPL